MGNAAGLFHVDAAAYDRFMGRYSMLLAPRFADAAGVAAGLRALDVGCGPGALTAELARRLGADAVAAVDPSPSFVEAAQVRLPGVDVRLASAEHLPFADDTFDAALAQLVLHFVGDPEAGVGQLRRVTRPGGTIAACTWDSRKDMRLLRTFWDAALAIDERAPDESRVVRFTRPDELDELFRGAGLEDVRVGALDVEARYESFDELWESVLGGVGPVGAFVASLDEPRRQALRADLSSRLGDPGGAFMLGARAWAAFGTSP